MEAYWGSGGIALRFFDLGTRYRRVISFTPRRFTFRESAPGIHWIGGWVGPRAGLDAVMKRKIPSTYRESNLPIIELVAPRHVTELSRLFHRISYSLSLISALHINVRLLG
jgi:hypothetical protein